MNIMFVFRNPIIPSQGGVQRVTDILAKEFKKRGCSVCFLAYNERERWNDYQYSAPQYVVNINNENIVSDLKTIITKENVSIVISQNMSNSEILQHLYGLVPIISVCHVQPFNGDDITRQRMFKTKTFTTKETIRKIAYLIYPRLQRLFIKEEKQMYRDTFMLSDKVCFLSSSFYKRVQRHWDKMPLQKCICINNPNTYQPEVIDWQRKENIILNVGRIQNSNKNSIGFIKVWERIQSSMPEWKAIVLGDGPSFEDNLKYINRNKIPRIEMVGNIENVVEFYKRAKLLVVTSYSESWCMAVTEGMTFGCVPFVYDTYETLHEIISDGKNGFIVNPNVRDMSTAIITHSKSSLLESISKSAMVSVQAYSTEETMNKWENIINKTCKQDGYAE